jgi:lipopolysaccharide transport system ATP-binding protein
MAEPAIGNSDEVILVEHLTKKFRLPHEKKATLFEHMIAVLKGGSYSYEEFLALDDISFDVRHGETFGIIGPNGSGKSTLLKILAGVLYPDAGCVTVHGKIAPFLELGVGFKPDLSAKQNIFLYGAIMGLKKREIMERYEKILEFAELKQFESMRLKNFSSGMAVRLAFSTAIQTDPDILLVDEVLSVGDESFQEKCYEKINEMKTGKKTIVYVSHSLDSVLKLCDRCLLLEKGKIVQIGILGKL